MGILAIIELIKLGATVAPKIVNAYVAIVHRNEAGEVTQLDVIQVLDAGDKLALDLGNKIDRANAQ